MTTFTPQTSLHGFTVERKQEIREIRSTVLLLRHNHLGTPVLAIKNRDPNKTFCIAFRTVPRDSTGVAHILEHSVLMGSRRYPVRDVFGEINKGGLMTFLNAMTGADVTWYPFATRNMKEYFNIMDVYCDVTLNPLLERSTFEQEGWHYHLEAPEAKLQYQGVVYNEMKGAFSDPFRHLYHHTISALMPGSTYIHESGGDPAHIPDLSYENFLRFHQLHYHPSNSLFFFYGNAPLEEELEYIQSRFLGEFSEPGERAELEVGHLPDQMVKKSARYGIPPGTDPAGKTFLSLASVTGHSLEREKNIALHVIANILYNSDASPLKNAIIDSGICHDFGGLFVSGSAWRTFMMTYLIGSDPEHRDTFQDTVRATLGDLVQGGLDPHLVQAELSRYEFTVREEANKAQRGLDLINRALSALKYDGDPFEALSIYSLFDRIRTKAADSSFFAELIDTLLLANPASALVTLQPDADYQERQVRQESERLQSVLDRMDRREKEELVQRTQDLIRLQSTPNDDQTLSLLPALAPSDLNPEPSFHVARERAFGSGHLLLHHGTDTNTILYLDLGFDCRGLSLEQLSWLDLFATIVTEIGTREIDFKTLARELSRLTGGFSHSFSTYQRYGETLVRPVLWFHVKLLQATCVEGFDLIRRLLREVSFSDRQRIRDIVQREFAWAEHSVHSEGYSLASLRVLSHLSMAGAYNEQVSGASAYLALRDLARDYDQQEERFLASLEEMRTLLLTGDRLLCGLTADTRGLTTIVPRLQGLSDELPVRDIDLDSLPVPTFPSHARRTGFLTSSEVMYNVQGCRVFPSPLEQYRGGFEVLRTWLSRDYLWNTVRQLGGAYGCFIQFSQITGNLALISYRDPQIDKTFAAYQAIPDAVRKLDLSPKVRQQLVVGTYGSFDPHQGPAAQGATARNEYLTGIGPEFKKKRIREILSAETDELRDYADSLSCLAQGEYLASLGSGSQIRSHSSTFEEIIEL